MSWIKTIPAEKAQGRVLEQYNAALGDNGYIPHYLQAFSLRPEVYDAWGTLIGAIRSKMRLRRYELVTLAAAMALGCTYWMLAHGAVLRKNFFSAEELIAIVRDFRSAGLPPEEVAIMAFAHKVAAQAGQVTEADMAELRRFGLPDEEIFDIIAAAAARSFFSKVLDATVARPDDRYLDLEPELLHALVGERPFP